MEREREAMTVVDGLLALMRESPGWDFNTVDHAFGYLRRMRHAFPHAPLTMSVTDELRRRFEEQPQ
jgi:hypothetical protein